MKDRNGRLIGFVGACATLAAFVGAQGSVAVAHAATNSYGSQQQEQHGQHGQHQDRQGNTRYHAESYTVSQSQHAGQAQVASGTKFASNFSDSANVAVIPKKHGTVQQSTASQPSTVYPSMHSSSMVHTTSPTATVLSTPSHSAHLSTSRQLPPGVQLDSNIQPLQPLTASWQQKWNVVLAVAQSKLGTPYRWGHNEDRGQYGFDCSNFTAYVYHHALGYRMSGASRVQAQSVGSRVAIRSIRPGDLLIFDNGRHVGIYAGNGHMIQEGGGLGRVGYLSVAPGSYWYRHITAVKRMF